MKREEVKRILVEGGVETPSEVVVTSILNAFRDERELFTKELKEQIENDNKDKYVSKADYDKIVAENDNYKKASQENEHNSKLKELGVKEKYFKYAKDLDITKKEDVEKFKEDYPEFFEAEKSAPKTKKVDVGATKTTKVENGEPSNMEEAIFEVMGLTK